MWNNSFNNQSTNSQSKWFRLHQDSNTSRSNDPLDTLSQSSSSRLQLPQFTRLLLKPHSFNSNLRSSQCPSWDNKCRLGDSVTHSRTRVSHSLSRNRTIIEEITPWSSQLTRELAVPLAMPSEINHSSIHNRSLDQRETEVPTNTRLLLSRDWAIPTISRTNTQRTGPSLDPHPPVLRCTNRKKSLFAFWRWSLKVDKTSSFWKCTRARSRRRSSMSSDRSSTWARTPSTNSLADTMKKWASESIYI